MHIKSLFFALFCLFAASACHTHDDEDANPPVLTIENPTEGVSISGAVLLHVKATDESLHELEIKVTRDADGAELFKANPTVHDETEFHFEQSFTPGVSAETAITLTATVSDHGEHTVVKTVHFIVKP